MPKKSFALITITEGDDEYKESVEAEVLTHIEADARIANMYGMRKDKPQPIVRRLDKNRNLLEEQPEQEAGGK